MKQPSAAIYWLVISSATVLCSCSPNKSIYISNRTGSVVQFRMHQPLATDTTTALLLESLEQLTVKPGHTILYPGKGKWAALAKEQLKNLLSSTTFYKLEAGDSLSATFTVSVQLYGWFVNELVIKIR